MDSDEVLYIYIYVYFTLCGQCYVLTAERLSRLLDRFGLSTSCLSQSGTLSLSTLVMVSLMLGVQHASDSAYVRTWRLLILASTMSSCLPLHTSHLAAEITSVFANANGPCNAASCKIDTITLHTKCNYQAVSVS